MFDFLKFNGKTRSTGASPSDECSALRAKLDLYEAAFGEIHALAERVAKGDFTARIVHWDEFGAVSPTLALLNQSYDMADAYVRESAAALQAALRKEYHRKFLIQGMLGDLGRGAGVINDASVAMQTADERRRDELDMLAKRFEKQVMQVVSAISNAASQTNDGALELIDHARQEQELAKGVAGAAEHATMNVQTVAAAAEELSASIADITRQVASSSQKSAVASQFAAETSRNIANLDSASEAIGEVVQLINDIAKQTNLLALNATIEAARAGEAGKGFSVVAGEVKTLANQTAGATSTISDQVGNIQERTKQSVQSVENIHDLVTTLNEISTAISAATEQQSAATVEISRNIQEASEGTRQVSVNIVKVSETTGHTLKRAEGLLQASSYMHEQTALLQTESEEFVSMVRAL